MKYWTLNGAVEGELKDLRKHNGLLRAYRLPIMRRFLRLLLKHPIFTVLTVTFVNLAVGFIAETKFATIDYKLAENRYDVIADLNLYILSSQAAILGVIYAIAIALVTIVYQGNPARDTWVNVFFSETEVKPLGFLGLLLIATITIQSLFIDHLHVNAFISLTTINAFWFVGNLYGCGFFLLKASRFLKPREKVGLLRSYTANDAWLSEIREHLGRLIWVASAMPHKALLPDGTSKGVKFRTSRRWGDDGTPILHVKFSKGKALANIRFWALRHSCNRLIKWEGSDDYVAPSGNGYNDALSTVTFPIEPYDVYPRNSDLNEKTPIICIRRKDDSFLRVTEWQELWIRFAFSFKKSNWHEDKLSLEKVIRSLTESCIHELKQNNEQAFEEAWEQLCDYLEFLFRISVIKGTDDEPWQNISTNVASRISLMTGSKTLHLDWIEQFHHLAKHVVQELNQNPVGFRKAVYSSYYILSGVAGIVPDKIYKDISYISIYLFNQLNWQWKDAFERENGISAGPMHGAFLLEPLKSNYQNAYMQFVGAWEAMPRYIFAEDDNQIHASQWQWSQRKMQLAINHLEETTLFIARSVVSGNEALANWSVDMFLRWMDKIDLTLKGRLYLLDKQLVNTTLFNEEDLFEEWYRKKLREDVYGMAEDKASTPAVMSLCLANRREDTALASILVLILWSLDGTGCKLGDHKSIEEILTLKICRRLLERKTEDHQELRDTQSFCRNSKDIMWSVFRIFASGHRFENSYHSEINQIAERFDRLRNKEMVSGRVYSFSGETGIDSLPYPLAILLLLRTPDEPNVEHEIFPKNWQDKIDEDGPNVADRIVRFTNQLLDCLSKFEEQDISPILQALGVSENYHFMNRVNNLTLALQRIEEQNEDHIEGLEISQDRLNEFAEAATSIAFSEQPKMFPLSHFNDQNYDIDDKQETKKGGFPIGGFEKAELCEHPLGRIPVNADDMFGQFLDEVLADTVWRQILLQLPSSGRQLLHHSQFWTAVSQQAKDMERPILILPRGSTPKWLEDWLSEWHDKPEPPRPSNFDFKPDRSGVDMNHEGVIASDGIFKAIEVFSLTMRVGQCILLDGSELQTISFKEFDTGYPVQVSFKPDSNKPTIGSLNFDFEFQFKTGDLKELVIDTVPIEKRIK